jgi:putative ABC transport system permease protein
LACINYINLATARADNRTKEIGMKKVLGSEKRHLVIQLLGESLFASFIALFIAFGLVELIIVLPPINQLLNVDLKLILLNNPILICGSFGLGLFIGLISGLYPAYYLSSIVPVRVLSGARESGKKASFTRRILVTFQFIISIGVVIFTLLMNDQIEFMRNQELGFKKDHLVIIDIRGESPVEKIPALLSELRRHPDIISVTTGHQRPGKNFAGLSLFEGKAGMEEHNFYLFIVNYDYLDTLGIEILQGRGFDKNYPSDKSNAVLVNEKLLEYMGWDNPIGKRVTRGLRGEDPRFSGEVVGVVKDFNFRSLHNEIEPLYIMMQQKASDDLIVRFKGENFEEILRLLENIWNEINPGDPFVYSFLDEEFDRLYDADRQQHKLIIIFSMICILICSLGLLGLASYNASQRTREIAIRKVYGASSSRIVTMLFKEVFLLVTAASVIATPLSLLLINMWLQNFAYRTDIDILIFVVTAIAALIIAFLTASYHCLRVARENPIEALRYE